MRQELTNTNRKYEKAGGGGCSRAVHSRKRFGLEPHSTTGLKTCKQRPFLLSLCYEQSRERAKLGTLGEAVRQDVVLTRREAR